MHPLHQRVGQGAMWRKSLLAIWRNSQKKLRRPKGNSCVCRDDRCCSRCGSSSRKRDNAIIPSLGRQLRQLLHAQALRQIASKDLRQLRALSNECPCRDRLKRMVCVFSIIYGNRCCAAERSTTLMRRNPISLVPRHLYTLSSS
jgi:hypothetical protein